MINIEQLIVDFKNSKYWNLLFEKYKVLMIQVVGSQLTGYVDERSDLDLIVICEDSPIEEEPLIRLRYDGHSIHWCYKNYKYAFTFDGKTRLNQLDIMSRYYLTMDKILYVDDKFKPASDFLVENKDIMSKLAAKVFALRFDELINNVLNSNCDKKHYTKWLSHLMMCYGVLTDTQIDYDLLMAIKRIRWSPTTEEQRVKCCEILRALQSLVANDDIDALTSELEHYSRLCCNKYLIFN